MFNKNNRNTSILITFGFHIIFVTSNSDIPVYEYIVQWSGKTVYSPTL